MKRFGIVLITLLFSATYLSAKTVTVTNGFDSGAGTLRQAIIDADNSDTIIFADNITTVYFAAMIMIDKNVTICGNETNRTMFQNAKTGWTGTLKDTRYLMITSNAEASLYHLIMKDNSAHCSGGAIYNSGKLTVNCCTFTNCKSLYDAGGAIYNPGKLTVNNCTFHNNYASIGAAIYNRGDSAVVANSLFTKNNANANGAIHNSSNSTVTILNCTMEGNTGNSGVAITNRGTAVLHNNIIWNNKGVGGYNSDIIADGTMTAYNNIISQAIAPQNLTGNGNIIGENPLFVGNGDYRLQEGSPAIDKGNNTCLSAEITKDLAGNPRVSGGTVDMGAYEYQNQNPNWCDSVVTILKDSLTTLNEENSALHDSIVLLYEMDSVLTREYALLKRNYYALQRKNNILQDSIVALLDTIATLQNNHTILQNRLKDSIAVLLGINSTLRSNNIALQRENNILQKENEKLFDEIIILQDSVDTLFIRLSECEAGETQNVSRMAKSDVRVYPNPVNRELRITNYEFKQGDVVEIFDMNGKRVYVAKPNSTSSIVNSTLIIDVSHLPTGTYLLRISQQNNEFLVAKVVKM